MRIHVSASVHLNKIFGSGSEIPVHAEFQNDNGKWAFYLRLHPERTDAAVSGDFSKGVLGSEGIRLLDECRLEDMGFFYSQEPSPSCLPMVLNCETRKQISTLLCGESMDSNMSQGSCIYMWLLADLKDISVLGSLLTIGYDGNESLVLLAGLKKAADGSWKKAFYADLPSVKFLNLLDLKEVKLRYRELEDNKTDFMLYVNAEMNIIKTIRLTGTLNIQTVQSEKKETVVSVALSAKNPIDLKIVKFYSALEDGNAENSGTLIGGPNVTFQYHSASSQKEMELSFEGKISFLDCVAPIKEATYHSYGNQTWMLSMKFQVPDELEWLFGKSACLIYDSQSGFRITESGDCMLGDLLDFAKELNQLLEATKTSSCKTVSLGDKNKKIKIKTDIKPNISGLVDSENGYRLSLSGSVFLIGDGDTLNIEWKLPDNIGFSISPESLVKNLLNAVLPKITEKLMDLFKKFISGEDGNSENAEQLKDLMIYLFEKEAKNVVNQLVCRKLSTPKFADIVVGLIAAETTANTDIPPFVPPLPFGDRGGSGGSGSGDSGSGSSGSGDSGSGSSGSGDSGSGSSGSGDSGSGGSGSGDSGSGTLLTPEFKVCMSDEFVRININPVSGADAYVIGVYSEYGQEQSVWRGKYRANQTEIGFSVLEVPVYGKVSVFVCAISESKSLAGAWSLPKELPQISFNLLIRLAYANDYCIRDCYAMLTDHHVTITDRMVLKAVIETYGKPEFSDS